MTLSRCLAFLAVALLIASPALALVECTSGCDEAIWQSRTYTAESGPVDECIRFRDYPACRNLNRTDAPRPGSCTVVDDDWYHHSFQCMGCVEVCQDSESYSMRLVHHPYSITTCWHLAIETLSNCGYY